MYSWVHCKIVLVLICTGYTVGTVPIACCPAVLIPLPTPITPLGATIHCYQYNTRL